MDQKRKVKLTAISWNAHCRTFRLLFTSNCFSGLERNGNLETFLLLFGERKNRIQKFREREREQRMRVVEEEELLRNEMAELLCFLSHNRLVLPFLPRSLSFL
ncbi:hypothetical protein L484_025249 [Morus notabilis]|uniref:Uncharacterized protein n=1 Tax=Morus notabilis TaxID=981085 RepID=W9S299_9ROSA|nr:hypothetical protein L484_025249 [Morus notabilis]